MGRGGGEGRVPSLMTYAVEREVPNSYFFLSSSMCRPWGIRLKRELNEVCINPKVYIYIYLFIYLFIYMYIHNYIYIY